MLELKKNMVNMYGNQGLEWLNRLPSVKEILAQQWGLSHIQPLDNLSYHYVAFAKDVQGDLLALKIGLDDDVAANEYRVLNYFNGSGTVKVIDYDATHNALLLERATPGTTLKASSALSDTAITLEYAKVVDQLATVDKPLPDDCRSLSTWLSSIDHISAKTIDSCYIDKARSLSASILATMTQTYLCHADLHFENIIRHGTQWVAIDPKGVVADKCFEASSFDLIIVPDMTDAPDCAQRVMLCANQLADALQVDVDRLLIFVYLRTIISAQWFIEDHADDDAKDRITRLKLFYHILNHRGL